MAKKKRKLKKGVVYGLFTAGALTILASGYAITRHPEKADNKEKTKATQSFLSESEVKEILSSGTTEFNMGDFRIPQGDRIVVTTNSGNSEGLIYSSNNEDVVIIESDGTLTAVAPGTAAITVTEGNVSKSIVVEVIEDKEDLGENNLPIYTEAEKVIIDSKGDTEQSSKSNNGEVPTQAPTKESTSKATQSVTKTSEAVTRESTLETTQRVTQGATVSTTKSNPATTNTTTASSEKYTQGITSEELYEYLPSMGFTQRVSNAYIYEKDGEYLGQVILESKGVHIYIKSSSTGFDSKLEEILALLLPGGYDSIMSAYSQATSDKAFLVGDRKVQIIAWKNDDHKQIIIYN